MQVSYKGRPPIGHCHLNIGMSHTKITKLTLEGVNDLVYKL